MRACIGTWTVGPKVAHCILLLLSFHYNIATEIKCSFGLNFDHAKLYYIDWLQHWVQEIFGATIYLNHRNVLKFNPIDFVSLGIGLLHYLSDYIDHG